MYGCAIFYTIDIVPENIQFIFYLNPIYIYITYFRDIVVFGYIPNTFMHILSIGYALFALFAGLYVYYKSQNKFIYYI